MGLMQRIFRGTRDKDGNPPATAPGTLFHESETTQDDNGPRHAPRREVVQVILQDTMRKHGIPSDWIECRILSTVHRDGRNGMHVSFVVRQAHDKLMAYVFAFQDSFLHDLQRFEPQSKDWLFSVGWQFEGQPAGSQKTAMPDAKNWVVPAAAGGVSAVAAAMAGAPDALAVPAAAPAVSASAFAPTVDPLAEEAQADDDDDIADDLAALFAIRDAALAQPLRAQDAPEDQPDFEPTRPSEEP